MAPPKRHGISEIMALLEPRPAGRAWLANRTEVGLQAVALHSPYGASHAQNAHGEAAHAERIRRRD